MNGRSLIGSRQGGDNSLGFQAVNPATSELLAPRFVSASGADIELATKLAAEAAAPFAKLASAAKGKFLRTIAAKLEAIAPALIERTGAETALPPARLQGEMARTCNQLRLFASVVEEGSWVMGRWDRPREGTPRKPDLRSMLRPLGPVVVFGASNFPLAFSVAGGDTASAFAAGNPVIVKAHSAHPGASELAGQAIADSVRECGLPEGVFSLLFGAGTDVGAALVIHPLVRAVGFTGSFTAGRHLMDLAAARPEPIPVYAEMGSINPVFILPRALAERGETIAAGLHASVTLGAGQFCTKPGLVFLPAGAAADPFAAQLGALMEKSAAFVMLTGGIARAYATGSTARAGHPAVRSLAQATVAAPTPHNAAARLFQTSAGSLQSHPELAEELFGPSTLLVRHTGKTELLELARGLHGHLTATVHATPEDLREYSELIDILQTKAGRVIVNGFPTGVEVAHAMVHGGPYPATSDGRSTSVGSQAIFRFTRAVCFQDVPDTILPPELQDANPLRIWRMTDGNFGRE